MKSLLWFGILSIFTSFAQAGNFYTPLFCGPEDSTLVIQNQSPETRPFWFQAVGSTPFQEAYFEVKAQGQLQLPLAEIYRNPQAAVAIKTHDNSLSFRVFCKAQQQTSLMEANSSPWKLARLSNPPRTLHLWAANLSQQDNRIQITLRSRFGVVSQQQVNLSEEFQSESFDLNIPADTLSIEMKAQGRWSAKLLAGDQELRVQDQTRSLTSLPNGKRYFLFRSRDPGNLETFVVPMDSPKLIQESLEQIADPGKARLFIGRIEKTQNGQNRDFSSVTKTPWSWHVSEAQNYADLAHISCNGTPGLVEERLNSWLQETGGTICFWNYRVVRELKPEELTQAPLWSPLGPQFLPHKH